MKILVIQLARFGDIYQTWPTLKGLRRVHPNAEIHILVRERFADAARGLDDVHVHTLPTADWLEPLLTGRSTEEALARVDTWLRPLQEAAFDRIVNLSFSQTSSYLVSLLAHEHTSIQGYTRYNDGLFAIVDDASAYFHAQVGVEKENRIHLVDLMALIAGIELDEQDQMFADPEGSRAFAIKEPYICIHLGASQKFKHLSASQWQAVLNPVWESRPESVVLIGGPTEAHLAPAVRPEHENRVLNLIGKTELTDLFPLIRRANLLVGCDSMATQIAALTGTKMLQFSFAGVKFWETGPRVKGSRILLSPAAAELDTAAAGAEIVDMLSGSPLQRPVVYCHGGNGVLYEVIGLRDDSFAWELVRGIYMGGELPFGDRAVAVHAMKRLSELAALALEQIRDFADASKRHAAIGTFNDVENLMSQVGRLVPEVRPLIQWYETEKLRIPPGPAESVLESSQAILMRLNEICIHYEAAVQLRQGTHKGELTWK